MTSQIILNDMLFYNAIQHWTIFPWPYSLVVVFLQFKICMRFPRHMYNDMVLQSTIAFVAIDQWMLVWWKPGQYAQNGGNQDNAVRFKYWRTTYLPPLVVVFSQFKICMRFPRHMYKNMVLLSIAVLGPFKNELIRWMFMEKWQFIKICHILMTRQL